MSISMSIPHIYVYPSYLCLYLCLSLIFMPISMSIPHISAYPLYLCLPLISTPISISVLSSPLYLCLFLPSPISIPILLRPFAYVYAYLAIPLPITLPLCLNSYAYPATSWPYSCALTSISVPMPLCRCPDLDVYFRRISHDIYVYTLCLCPSMSAYVLELDNVEESEYSCTTWKSQRLGGKLTTRVLPN